MPLTPGDVESDHYSIESEDESIIEANGYSKNEDSQSNSSNSNSSSTPTTSPTSLTPYAAPSANFTWDLSRPNGESISSPSSVDDQLAINIDESTTPPNEYLDVESENSVSNAGTLSKDELPGQSNGTNQENEPSKKTDDDCSRCTNDDDKTTDVDLKALETVEKEDDCNLNSVALNPVDNQMLDLDSVAKNSIVNDTDRPKSETTDPIEREVSSFGATGSVASVNGLDLEASALEESLADGIESLESTTVKLDTTVEKELDVSIGPFASQMLHSDVLGNDVATGALDTEAHAPIVSEEALLEDDIDVNSRDTDANASDAVSLDDADENSHDILKNSTSTDKTITDKKGLDLIVAANETSADTAVICQQNGANQESDTESADCSSVSINHHRDPENSKDQADEEVDCPEIASHPDNVVDSSRVSDPLLDDTIMPEEFLKSIDKALEEAPLVPVMDSA